MTPRRKYTKRQKMTVALAADMTSVEAAAEAAGIPRTTVIGWMDQPEIVELRHNARERMAEETLTVARLAWQLLGKRIAEGDIQTRDLVLATGMATDKAQLLNGGATDRTETRDITGTISDAELSAAILEAESLIAAGRGPQEDPGTPEG